MKRVLFIDRDGTIIVEPEDDYQVDSLDKLEFIPGAISNLRKISEEGDFIFVMVSNQDGLGTDSFLEEDFWPAHNLMLKTLEGEGVTFYDILIDRSLPEENLSTRKPGTDMLTKYITGEYDLANSYVIGDRQTDIQMAKNLGCKSIHLTIHDSPESDISVNNWDEIYRILNRSHREVKVNRKTGETDIQISLNLDGKGRSDIQTGIGFYDHMLEQIAKHGQIDLKISVTGDLEVDEHHTIEDTAIALGEAFLNALGDKKDINRYGFLLPMDDSLAQVAIDFGGRPWLEWQADFKRDKIGEMPTEMFYHFFKSFSDCAKCNLNIKAEGSNEHHKIEAIFKAFARAIKMAIQKDPESKGILPSTKGKL
ncbi:bifunctional histidinol-phosphatase/imidazoleglycerol-phosphate dehydratase HisB [Bacteroidota bacterium]